ncbi:MAG: tetratricopeptide repeat protein [Desulforhopalus sp.]|nr:tetratricopeptide repeat protein [Desulforhopalus sp.]
MKKLVWSVFLLFFAMTLEGCAIPKKTPVYPTSSSIPSKQQGTTPLINGKRPPPSTAMESGEPEHSKAGEENYQASLPSAGFINDRITEYNRKLERWKELDSQSGRRQVNEEESAEMVRCFRKLQNVLHGYTELRGRLLQADKMAAAEKISSDGILELEKNDIAFLEGSCGQLLADSPDKNAVSHQREEPADLSQFEALIDRHSGNRDYQEVAQVWQKIPSTQSGRVSLRTKIHYGNALVYLNREEKAAEIFQQVVDEMSTSDAQATDLVSLRKNLADLYIASGNYRAAAAQYKKISDDYQNLGRLEEWSKLQLSIIDRSKEGGAELKEYSAMLRDYLGYVAEKDGYKLLWQAEKFLIKYPYSPVASNVDIIKAKVKADADKWFEGFIAKVDKLRAEKKFQEAQDLLQTLPPDIVGPEKLLAVKGKTDELTLTDAVEKESQRMAHIQVLQNQWNNGMLLAKAEKFDEAIAVFTKLLDSEFSAKASEKIKEMSLEAAKSDRKKAANLFTRFTKTTDPESKKKLLIETHKLLKSILVKYPDVDIKAKVIGNIERVEQEMMNIDPKLIVQVDQGDNLPSRADGLDGTFASPTRTANDAEQDAISESDLVLPPKK